MAVVLKARSWLWYVEKNDGLMKKEEKEGGLGGRRRRVIKDPEGFVFLAGKLVHCGWRRCFAQV